MVSSEEKARRKQQFQAELQRREQQAALKERLKAAQAQRVVNGPRRPLQFLVKAENSLKAKEEEESPKKKSLSMPSFGFGKAMGATTGAAAATGKKAVDAISDPGMILFIVGLLSFFFVEYANNVILALMIGSLFLFYSAFFILKNRGIIVVVIFWIWYVYMGGALEPSVLLTNLMPLVLIGMIVHGIISKIYSKESFAQGVMGELIYGGIAVLIFFLDLGLLDFFVRAFNYQPTPLVISLLRFVPWWGLFGLFTTKKESTLIGILKVLAGVYLIIILLTSTIGTIQDYNLNALGPKALLEAKQQTAQLTSGAENPLKSQLICFWQDFANAPKCVDERQKDSIIKSTCKSQGFQEGTALFEDCLTAERIKKDNPAFAVGGSYDPTIKNPTTAKITIDKSLTQAIDASYLPPLIAELEIKNPRKQQIEVEMSCYVERRLDKTKVIGMVENPPTIVGDSSYKGTFVCTLPPEAVLKDAHTLHFEAVLQNLETSSWLQRAFVGDMSPPEIDILTKKEIKLVIPKSDSQGPAEFAIINFDLGHALGEVVVKNKWPTFLRANIENKGTGRIVQINNYNIDLGTGFELVESSPSTIGSIGCLKGSLIDEKFFNEKVQQRKIPLPLCKVTKLPEELEALPNPETGEEWVPKEFTAKLNYNYLIVAQTNLNIGVYS